MRITAIVPHARNHQRVELDIDGAFRLAVAVELVHQGQLRVGDVVSEAQLRELERQDAHWRAREDALNLLSFRARTGAEMRQRLLRKGYAEPVVERCVAELTDRGLIDDASFAQCFVRDRLRSRPRGSQRLLQELRTRGVDWETARASLDEVWQGESVSELDLARQAAERWTPRPGETRLRARRRLYNFLARRGFGAELIHRVVGERLP